MKLAQGTVIGLIAGYYDVETAAGIVRTRARGVFRQKKQKPAVGDRVYIAAAGGRIERTAATSVEELERVYFLRCGVVDGYTQLCDDTSQRYVVRTVAVYVVLAVKAIGIGELVLLELHGVRLGDGRRIFAVLGYEHERIRTFGHCQRHFSEVFVGA